jgi:hypothetical protein
MLSDEIIMIEFDPSQFKEDKIFMCVEQIYKGEVWVSRNGKVHVRCNSTVNAESARIVAWTVVASADPKYSVGDWFNAAMGHALPCKNPNGISESSRECRLHPLDAVDSTSKQTRTTDAVVNLRKLIPNADLTDLVVESATAPAPVKTTAKALSVTIVKDPQAARSANVKNTTVKKVSATSTKQGRDKYGRYLSKTVTVTTSTKQGRDKYGRYLPKN